jgi:hypothetical protein
VARNPALKLREPKMEKRIPRFLIEELSISKSRVILLVSMHFWSFYIAPVAVSVKYID